MKKYYLLTKIFTIFLFIPKIIQTKDKQVKDNKLFSILKLDKDFIKPKIKLNSEFELIEMKNGMHGLLINDPYSTISHIHFELENGCFTDSISSLSHLAEHMIFQGSENYKHCYPILREIGGIKLYSGGAITGQTNQEYFYTIPYNFKFENALKVFVDAFKHPLYLEETIKKEIQPLNSEFYFQIDEQYHLLDAIIRQLCSNKTSFYGFTSGNNYTLNPNDSKDLSKKLKAYHNIVNKPENIFFVIYSNLTINELEKYCEKYLNYEMKEFPESEIDILEGKKIFENLENYKKFDIFDENLYEHGIYFNSHTRKNYLSIFFNVGDVDFKDLEFDLFEYFSYLFNSESLIDILKQKDYISSIYNIEAIGSILIQNNNVFSVNLDLSENGVNNIKDFLLIIYKYIDIMKKEGYKKDYFLNFIRFRQNQNNKDFQKEMFNILTTFSDMIESYRAYGVNQIFNYGSPTYENYNQQKLKKLLNMIKFEKSFFIINTISKASNLKTFLENQKIKKLKYYNTDFLYGKIPNSLKNDILEKKITINNLSMRNINSYFSKMNEKDIPCYKQKINNCKELNEFDYELEDKYNGTLLEDDKYYITYYQIDKSSETFIVNSYLDLTFIENENITNEIIDIIKFYINDKLSIINEVPTISIVKFNQNSIAFKIQSFTDNTEKIYKDFIKYLKQGPTEILFNYSKISNKAQNIEKNHLLFRDYVFGIGNRFMSGGVEVKQSIDDIIQKIDNISFDYFKHLYSYIFNKITLISFKIAGNINRNLVKTLHDYIKDNLKIFFEVKNLETCEKNEENEENDLEQKNDSQTNENNKNIDTSNNSKNSNNSQKDFSYIIDYYQKSNMPNELDGGIFIIYRFDDKFKDYMDVLKGCLENIAKIYLRFELSHSYHPKIYVENNFLMIFEQGRYREPTEMEDEINEVILGMIEGKIKCDNYKDIVKSYKMKNIEIFEKNPANLFNQFIDEGNSNENENNNYLKKKFPKNFTKFMKKLSTIFTEPKRYTILVSRYDLSDDLFKEIIKKRKETAKYILNENIRIIYTDNIEFLKPRN